MKKILILASFCVAFTVTAVRADIRVLLDEIRTYGERVDRIEKSAEKVSLQPLVQGGTAIADKLRPVIEEISEADYDFVLKNFKGFVVGREEAIVIEPDSIFFLGLANKVGTENDRLFFHFLNEVKPDGSWPVYIEQQTDVGGCTKYGDGHLSALYKKGKALLPKLTGYYGKQTRSILEDLSYQLTAGTCACDNQQSVVKELRSFLEINKESEITGKVKTRLDEIQKNKTGMEYNCIGGR